MLNGQFLPKIATFVLSMGKLNAVQDGNLNCVKVLCVPISCLRMNFARNPFAGKDAAMSMDTAKLLILANASMAT